MASSLSRLGVSAVLLAGTSAYVHARKADVERRHPPAGRFLEVGGVRLHYLEQGEGPALVLLHGLGSMSEELALSGLLREASTRYRVIAFDRPGYGYSTRPGRFRFTPEAQAQLFARALQSLGVERAVVFGHSWGTLVAIALALNHPGLAASLVLASGLYFPSVRLDGALLAPPALPLIGAVMRHTVSPLIGRALWPAWLKAIFAPAPVPAKMRDEFPAWMVLRPRTLRAVGEEALLTYPTTVRASLRYRELELPVVLVAGASDRYVDTTEQTARLHELLPASRLLLSEAAGHMVHHSDLPLVLIAIDTAHTQSSALASS